MSTTLHLPLPARNPSPLACPKPCVGCGAAPESRLVVHRLVMRGQKQEQVALTLLVPHCQRCARATKTVFMAGCVPFVLGGLLVGLVVFVVVAFGASLAGLDEMGQPGQANSLILGAFVGLIAGFIFEVLARVVLLPFLGPALLRAPLLAQQLLNDSDYVAGLAGKLNADASRLELTFAREDVAREFVAANGGGGG